MASPLASSTSPDAPSTVTWRLGTMGFSYTDWTGPFYPPATNAQSRLSLYASCFDTVELDTTFHAIPAPETVRRWAAATPEHFRFTAKLPKTITHATRDGLSLISHASRQETAAFLRVMAELGPKLRAVLVQFPPSFTAEAFGDLSAFVEAWPKAVPAAVEVRHDSWWQRGVGPATARLLRGRNMPWVIADEPPQTIAHLPPDAVEAADVYHPRPAVLTADWLYLRWIGRHDQFPDRASQRLDPAPRLTWWADKLQALADSGRVREIIGFFNNGYSGHSPLAARRMRDLLHLPDPPTPAQQASLF